MTVYGEHIRYPKSKLVHKAFRGRLHAACGYVPWWHTGAVKVDEPVTCQCCLHGPTRTAWR